jgi:hypothetical protein
MATGCARIASEEVNDVELVAGAHAAALMTQIAIVAALNADLMTSSVSRREHPTTRPEYRVDTPGSAQPFPSRTQA